MPKVQQPPIAVNQQGHALSYVLGVYFGDGCIDRAWTNKDGSETWRIRLRAIDDQFIARFAESLKEAFPGLPIHVQMGMNNGDKGHWGKKPLHCVTMRSGVPEYLLSIAGQKTLIPSVVYRSDEDTRSFIEGILDSEGWVAVPCQELGRFYLQVGLAMTSDVVYEVQKMLLRMGIKVGSVRTKHYPSGKIMKTMSFNTASFLGSGLRFTATRKQNRIDTFVRAQKMLKEAGFTPNGVSFNDYKLKFRENLRRELLANG